ncbi:amidohydrolase family protein, partial [Amycolatopsis pithecellobii]
GLGSVAATEKDLATIAAAGTKLVGVRAMHRWRPDGEVLADPRVADSFRVLAERELAVDLFVNDHTELPLLPALVERAPGRYVVDHLGRPPVEGDRTAWRLWADAMTRLAALPGVYVKFSGWATVIGRTTAEDVAPFLTHVLDTFGPRRTMYAGNWPVALCAADDYAQIWAASSEVLAALGAADLDAVLGGTARDCYRFGS